MFKFQFINLFKLNTHIHLIPSKYRLAAGMVLKGLNQTKAKNIGILIVDTEEKKYLNEKLEWVDLAY